MTAIANAASKLEVHEKSVRRRLRKLGYGRKDYAGMTPSKIVQVIKKKVAA